MVSQEIGNRHERQGRCGELVVDRSEQVLKLGENDHQHEDHDRERKHHQENRIGQRRNDDAPQPAVLLVHLQELLQHPLQEAPFLGGRDQADVGLREHLRMAGKRHRERLALGDRLDQRLEDCAQPGILALLSQGLQRLVNADAGVQEQRKLLREDHALVHPDRARRQAQLRVQKAAEMPGFRGGGRCLADFECHAGLQAA